MNNLRSSKIITHLNHITLSTYKQDTHYTKNTALGTITNKTDTELKPNTNILRCKKPLKIATFNVRTLRIKIP